MANSKASRSDTGGAEGVDFQLNIVAWTLFRAHKLYKGKYTIYSEMIEAEKFDDVVLKYQDNDGQERFRFLQAKHVKDEAKKNMSLKDLINGKKFNINIYFKSFTDIVKNEKFKNKVKDVLLFTNLDINKDLHPYLAAVQDVEPIFQFEILKTNQLYKFKTNFIETYRNGILHRLANALIDSCSAQGTDKIKNFKEYHGILLKDVYDVKQNQFRPDFVERKELSAVTEIFREIFEQEILIVAPDTINWMTSAKLSASAKLGKPGGSWPPIFEMDNETTLFLDFCDKFILAVNQPNESELNNCLSAANEINVDITELRDELRVWFKNYNYPLNDNFINELTSFKEINKIKRELAEQQIEFIDKSLQTELNNFLSQNEQKILQIRTIVDCKATSLKLQCDLMKQSINNYVVLPTNDKSELKNILDVFSKSQRYDLLIWETHRCPIDFDLLKDINIWNQEAKKIIMICDNKLQLPASDVGIDEQNIIRIDDETKYAQLTEATKKRLNSKTIEFQGQMIQLNQICSFDHISFDSSNSSWTHFMKKNIVIGAKPKLADEYKIGNNIHRTMSMKCPYFDRKDINEQRSQFHFALNEDEFKDMEKQHKGSFVHLFREENDKIVWQRSTKGGLQQLDDLNLNTPSMTISDYNTNLIRDLGRKVLILTDPAGMGKTVTSSYLAQELKRQHPNYWVIRLEAMEYARTLSQFKDNSQLDHSSILNQVLKIQSPIEELIFDQYLSNDVFETKLIIN